jgi:hypothetical protein
MNAITGPRMNPIPKAAPIKPSPWVRVLSLVLSEMAAWAVEIFAPDRPSMIRETNRRKRVLANPNRIKPARVPSWLITRIGLRPYLSDSRPRMGAPRNCIIG